jgi:hypothetical protein
MSTNISIILPHNVSAKEALVVIGRCVGTNLTPQSAWVAIDAEEQLNQTMELLGDGLWLTQNKWGGGSVVFYDCAKNRHEWLFNQVNSITNCKCFTPGSTAMAIALGTRLVKFFGGRVVEAEHPSGVILWRAGGQGGLTERDGDNVGLLTVKEIQDANKIAKYKNLVEQRELCGALRAIEQLTAMEIGVAKGTHQNKARL